MIRWKCHQAVNGVSIRKEIIGQFKASIHCIQFVYVMYLLLVTISLGICMCIANTGMLLCV